MTKPVLLLGGYGRTGQKTAQQLRALQPEVPLAIAGRDLSAAKAFAEEIGNAEAYRADLWGDEENLGLPHGEFSAMATFLMDDSGRSLRFAQRHGFGSVAVTGGAFELGLQTVLALQAANDIPVVIAGNWFCGAALWPILALCKKMESVDRVDVGIVIDRNGAQAGPATMLDFERILGACSSMPQRVDKRYQWIPGDQGSTTYIGTGGRELEGRPSVSIDAVTIGAVTDSADVTILETWGDSLASLNGAGPTDEIVVEATGRNASGKTVKLRQEIIASRDECPFTAIAIALLLERTAGLSGPALKPGLYFPEHALDAAEASKAMALAGVQFSAIFSQLRSKYLFA